MSPATAKAKDAFDSIDIFDVIDTPRLKTYTPPPKVDLRLSDEIRALIQAKIDEGIKAAVAEAVAKIKPHTVETKTVERVVEKSIPTPERIIEKVDDARLQKEIDEKIRKAVDETNVFIPAPPIIPNWSDKADGVVLSKTGSQLKWVAQPAGTSSDEYTVANGATLRTFDANDTSLDELADVLASLIDSLQGAGIIQ